MSTPQPVFGCWKDKLANSTIATVLLLVGLYWFDRRYNEVVHTWLPAHFQAIQNHYDKIEERHELLDNARATRVERVIKAMEGQQAAYDKSIKLLEGNIKNNRDLIEHIRAKGK